MILLDTNVVSELVRPSPHPDVMSWVAGLGPDTAITAVTLAELHAGLSQLPQGRRREALAAAVDVAVKAFEGAGLVLPFDAASARLYGAIVAGRSALGRPISTADAQIAAITRRHDGTLATRNIRDFEETGIDLIDPWGC